MSYNTLSRKRSCRLSTPVRLGVAAVAACFLAAPVLSNPVNPTVVNGVATFNQVGNVLTVTNSNGAIINWDKFSIKAGETTHFAQTSASSSVLNRVLYDPTAIYGTLSSNGRVWLVNPAGIMVGAGGRVDVAGFVASTLNIGNADFLAGRNLFVNDGTAKDVINQGQITTPAGGSVYLIGSNVSNEGIITTPQGETILAAGATVSLIDSALPGVKVDITGATGNSTNLGTITAEAGRIGIAGVIVKNSGTLNASSVVNEGGRIFLKASQDAYVDGNGRIVTTGAKGGSVEVLGNRVAVMDNASIDASATREGGDGGTIKVGGDYQGKNPDIQNAGITYFGPNASLKADAGKVGAGGSVIVWADDTTRAFGTISTRGGASGGNGGFVETSGKRALDVVGINVNPGMGGSWLLDPERLTISHNATVSGFASPFDPITYGGTLTDASINAAINAGANVTVQTTDSTDGGNILFDGVTGGGVVIDKTTNTFDSTLNIEAYGGIIFKGATTFKTSASAGTRKLAVVLDAGKNGAKDLNGYIQSLAGDGAVVTLNGYGGGSTVEVMLGTSGSTSENYWENSGTINLNGASNIIIYDNNADAIGTFENKVGGVVNVNSSMGWSFLSGINLFGGAGEPAQNGLVNNAGTINVNTLTSWAARFSQGSGGILNINGSAYLSMQHLDVAAGTINLNSTASYALLLLEQHSGLSTFYGASIVGVSGPKRMQIGTSGSTSNITTFNNVSTSGGLEVLVPELGTLNFTGANTFADTKFFKGDSGANKHWVIPVATYTGTTQWWAKGDISFAGNTTFGGAVTLGAGWNSNIATPGVTPGSGSIQIVNRTVQSSGDLTMMAGGNIVVDQSNVEAATMSLIEAKGTLSVLGGATSGGLLKSLGDQNITANGIIVTAGTGNNAGAYITAYGDQVLNVSAGGIALSGNTTGSNTYGGRATIEQLGSGGSQTINMYGGGDIVLIAGNATGTSSSQAWSECTANAVTVSDCNASGSGAEIRNKGSGGQAIKGWAAGTIISLTGGGGGYGNSAEIHNDSGSLLEITGNILTNRPTITITGGLAGGKAVLQNDATYKTVDNSAGISSDGSLRIYANSLTMDGTGGAGVYGGAYIGSPDIGITTTGALTMTAGTGTDGGSLVQDSPLPADFYWMSPAVIGWDKIGTSITLDIGGTLTMAGGAMGLHAGSPVMIGGIHGITANVDISAGAFNSTSTAQFVSRIGTTGSGSIDIETTTGALALSKSLVGLGSGDVQITAYGGVTQNVLGRIRADTLTVDAGGGVSLPGVNLADTVDIDAGGSIDYTSYQSFLLTKAQNIAATTVDIRTVSASAYGGDIVLGDVGIAGATTVGVTAYGGIYDDNGNGVTNVTGNIVNLISFGGNSGDLAISADVKASNETNATVVAGSTYGGIRLWAIDNMPTISTMDLTDGATYQPSIGFYYGGSISSPNVNLNAGAGGSLLFAVGGDLTGAPTVSSAPSGGLILAAGGTLSLPSSFGSPSYDIGLLASSVVIGGQITGKNLTVGAGSLTIGSGGSLVSVGTLVGVVVNDVNITGGYMQSGTGDLELVVGGNLNIGNASYGGHIYAGVGQSVPSYTPDASIAVGGDLKLNNGAYIKAANDVYLDLIGSTSKLVLNDGTVGYSPSYIMSDIGTGVVGTTYLSFLGRSTGGVVIDGVETTTTVVGGSGFFVVGPGLSTPATAGAGLQITYSATNQDLCAISPDLCKPPGTADTPIDEPPPSFEITGPGGTKPGGTPGQTVGGTEGSFGGDGSEGGADNKDDKKDEKDKDKDKKADNGKDGKKDEKPGQKKVAQCGTS